MYALRLLALAASAAAFNLSPVAAMGRGPACSARMGIETLGYQTEAAGATRLVQEMGLADEISLLRCAVSRCAAEKDLDAQRTLLLQCHKVQHRLKANLKSLREQARAPSLPSPSPHARSPRLAPRAERLALRARLGSIALPPPSRARRRTR